jgi:hypothetical protein
MNENFLDLSIGCLHYLHCLQSSTLLLDTFSSNVTSLASLSLKLLQATRSLKSFKRVGLDNFEFVKGFRVASVAPVQEINFKN